MGDQETCLSGDLPRAGPDMLAVIMKTALYIWSSICTLLKSAALSIPLGFPLRHVEVASRAHPTNDQRGQHQMHNGRSWLLNQGRTGSMQGAIWEAKARR